MGRGATRVFERQSASLNKTNPTRLINFENNNDISKGGVLLALPALLQNGLLRNIKKLFSIPKGFYNLTSIFILLAFTALLRIKSIEAIKRMSPGEFGKILGLDRIPEIRTIREKLNIISEHKNAKEWSQSLSKFWIENNNDSDNEVFYVDGHIRVYNGKIAKLPKKYKTQKRLCVAGITDYWVNDKTGRPYFYISQIVDDGLIKTVKEKIVPRLLKEIACQESKNKLPKNENQYNFGLVFDRAGYSPILLKDLWEENKICCYTYKKYVYDKWDKLKFKEYTCVGSNNEEIKIKLAEKIYYHKIKKNSKIKLREIRKLTKSGHQTSLITTDYINSIDVIAIRMFSRWSQENFFKYMAENYGIDGLVTYATEVLDDTTKVKNPEFKRKENEIKKLNGLLTKTKKEFANSLLPDMENNDLKIKDILKNSKKIELYEDIIFLESEILLLKKQKKQMDKYIELSQLPEHQRFSGFINEKKHFLDLIKMIAYRAETAMSSIISEKMKNYDESRGLLKQIYLSDIDIKIDKVNHILEVHLHNFNNMVTDNVVKHLCQVLNDSDTFFPGTNLKLFYKLVSN